MILYSNLILKGREKINTLDESDTKEGDAREVISIAQETQNNDHGDNEVIDSDEET